MDEASVISRLGIKGATVTGGSSQYSNYVVKLNSIGVIDSSFVPSVFTENITVTGTFTADNSVILPNASGTSIITSNIVATAPLGPTDSYKEVLIKTIGANNNVLALQNATTVSSGGYGPDGQSGGGFSVLTFRDYHGYEMGAFGYGNPSGYPAGISDIHYFEISNLRDNNGTVQPFNMCFTTTTSGTPHNGVTGLSIWDPAWQITTVGINQYIPLMLKDPVNGGGYLRFDAQNNDFSIIGRDHTLGSAQVMSFHSAGDNFANIGGYSFWTGGVYSSQSEIARFSTDFNWFLRPFTDGTHKTLDLNNRGLYDTDGNISLNWYGAISSVGIRGSAPTDAYFAIGANYGDPYPAFRIDSSTNQIYHLDLKAFIVGAGNTGYQFKINNNGTLTTTLSLAAGAIGVNVANPSYTLDVGGTGHFSGNLTLDANINNVTPIELGYVHNVTSAIQTQLNAKALDSAVVHTTGNETIGGTKTFGNIAQGPTNTWKLNSDGSATVLNLQGVGVHQEVIDFTDGTYGIAFPHGFSVGSGNAHINSDGSSLFGNNTYIASDGTLTVNANTNLDGDTTVGVGNIFSCDSFNISSGSTIFGNSDITVIDSNGNIGLGDSSTLSQLHWGFDTNGNLTLTSIFGTGWSIGDATSGAITFDGNAITSDGSGNITANSIALTKLGLGVTPVVQQTGGVATAGASYTATEQGMLQKVYNTLRTFGLLS